MVSCLDTVLIALFYVGLFLQLAGPTPLARSGSELDLRRQEVRLLHLALDRVALRSFLVWEPKIDALRFPAYPSNDRANLALVFDEVDWAGNFVPAIDRVFVGRDPGNHRYWFWCRVILKLYFIWVRKTYC